MNNSQTKLINNDCIETFYYKNKLYYDLSNVIKYLIPDNDVSKFKALKKEMDIVVSNIKVDVNNFYLSKTCVDLDNLIKIIWCVNNPKIYNIRKWMIDVISERLKELNNPDIAIDRFKTISIKKGNNYKYIMRLDDEKLNINVMSAQEILDNEIKDMSLNSTNID